ncbi:MAG: class I SAM-dependent methyltransferase [Mycobacteriaceae bacterium]|nr:class I SAM-dependent methyltransferase [Mycobacteriaceae bacterium]
MTVPSTDFIATQSRAWSTYRQLKSAEESRSGPGSWMCATTGIRSWLPQLFPRYGIRSVLDAPCGDWNWMQHVDLGHLASYTGWDVEQENVKHNIARFGDRRGVNFEIVNLLTVDRIPRFDLVLCRDFLAHLPTQYIIEVLEKFRASGSRYLITNNYVGASNDQSCPLDGGHAVGPRGRKEELPGYYYRPVNIEAEPFALVGRCAAIPKSVRPNEDYADIPQEHVLFDLSVDAQWPRSR